MCVGSVQRSTKPSTPCSTGGGGTQAARPAQLPQAQPTQTAQSTQHAQLAQRRQAAQSTQRTQPGHAAQVAQVSAAHSAQPGQCPQPIQNSAQACQTTQVAQVSVAHTAEPAGEASKGEVRGGDLADCLSDTDIDGVVAPVAGRRYIEAACFYEMRTGRRPPAGLLALITERVKECGYALMPVHIRHHWTLATIFMGQGALMAKIFDSAPSAVTRKDMTTQFAKLGIEPSFNTHGKQPRGSNQCGLHVCRSALTIIHQKLRPPFKELDFKDESPPIVDLAEWRTILATSPPITKNFVRSLLEGGGPTLLSAPQRPDKATLIKESKPAAFVSADTVEFALSELATHTSGQWVLVGPYTFRGLFVGEKRMRALRKAELKGKSVAAVVHLIDHYCTVVYDHAKKAVTVFDSLMGYRPSERKNAVENFKTAVEALNEVKDLKVTEVFEPKQPAGSNECAFYAVNFLASAACGNWGSLSRELLEKAANDPKVAIDPFSPKEKRKGPIAVSQLLTQRKVKQGEKPDVKSRHVIIPAGCKEGLESAFANKRATPDITLPTLFTYVFDADRFAVTCPLCPTFDNIFDERDAKDAANNFAVHVWRIHKHNFFRVRMYTCKCGCGGYVQRADWSEHDGMAPCKKCNVICDDKHCYRTKTYPCIRDSQPAVPEYADAYPGGRPALSFGKDLRPARKTGEGMDAKDLAVGRDLSQEASETADSNRGSVEVSNFQTGGGTVPPLAQLQRHHMKILATATLRDDVPILAQGGMNTQTRAAHVRMLKIIGKAALSTPPIRRFAEQEAATFITRTITKTAAARKWKWSTQESAMGQMAGALKCVGHYIPGLPLETSWRISDAPSWSLAMKKVGTKRAAAIPQQAQVLSAEQVLDVCKKAPKETAAIIALTWITCGRTAGTVQIRGDDVQLMPDDSVAITLRRGKTIKQRRVPHTIHTKMGAFKPFIHRTLMDKQGTSEFLFPAENREARQTKVTRVLKAIREYTKDPSYRNNSLRRGALQCLAAAGASTETLLAFSGHSTEETLRIYLQFGRLLADDKKRTTDQAALKAVTLEGRC